MDHDQFFKLLLREFFFEFLLLFFPQWVPRIDFARIEWLDKETFLDPPQGARHFVDLVAKVPIMEPAFEGQPAAAEQLWLALVHIEVEAEDSVKPLRKRVFDYFKQLEVREGLPVLPIGVYLRVGLEGVGWDVYEQTFWGHPLVRFQYAYVGLPALDGEAYARGPSLLGAALSVLMKVPPEKREGLAWRALRRAVESQENDYRRYLLQQCVTGYHALSAEHEQEYAELLKQERHKGVQAMLSNTSEMLLETYFGQWAQKKVDKAVEKAVEKLEEKTERKLLRQLLEQKFGALSAEAEARLDACTSERLQELTGKLLSAQSLRELGLEE